MCPSRLPKAHEPEAPRGVQVSCVVRCSLPVDEPYDVAWFEQLASIEAKSFWFRARNRLIVSMLRKHFPDAEKMLELGVGTGYVLTGIHDEIPGLRLVGSDLYEEGLVFARQRLPDVEFARLDARALPYHDEFDVVGAFDVLEHVEDDSLILENVWQALRPGGGTILLVPQHPRLWSEADVMANHVRRYVRRDLVAKVRAAGFDPVRVTSFVTTLLPAMAVSRRGPYDPIRALVPGRLNRMFEAILDAERKLIERGISLPVGGSLLVVGRKPPAEPGR